MIAYILISVLVLLVVVHAGATLLVLVRRFLDRARRRNALAGARLWLTGIFLFLLFALIGVFWGFFSV
ncbi:MAG: hypothetical protein IPM23_10145 [Candidatus Melainabacteria bacterium]|nr:hypothetical protein [Candidatus Melainabacteria bacterium]